METKFTKGNWILSKYEPTDFSVHSDEGSGNDIALVRGSNEEAEANAKLIASAPEMLKQLIEINDVLISIKISSPNMFDGKHIQAIERLIKKATE